MPTRGGPRKRAPSYALPPAATPELLPPIAPTWRKDGLPEDHARQWRAGIVSNETGEGVVLDGEE